MRFELLITDVATPNGRIYPLKEVKKAVQKLKASVAAERIFAFSGEVDDLARIPLDRLTARVVSLDLEPTDDSDRKKPWKLTAELDPLNTSNGQILKGLSEDMIHAYPIGLGEVDDECKVRKYEILGVGIEARIDGGQFDGND